MARLTAATERSPPTRGPAGGQRPRQHRGGPALGRRQPGVAAGQGQAVGLADGGAADDLDGQRQVRGHAPDHGQLLEVLLSEVGPARSGRAKSLATTVDTPSKWPGRDAPSRPRSALHRHVDGGSRAAARTSRARRGKHHSTPASPHVGSPRAVPGVGGQVLGIAELQRVHVMVTATKSHSRRPADERPVPGLQGAHGRHDADAAASGPARVQGGEPVGDGSHRPGPAGPAWCRDRTGARALARGLRRAGRPPRGPRGVIGATLGRGQSSGQGHPGFVAGRRSGSRRVARWRLESGLVVATPPDLSGPRRGPARPRRSRRGPGQAERRCRGRARPTPPPVPPGP